MDGLSGIEQIKENLHIGRRYTLAMFNKAGYLEQRCFVLEHINYKPYKSLINPCLLVVKGSVDTLKWDKFIRLSEGKQFVIWKSYHKVNTEICVTRGVLDCGSGHTISEKSWPANDPRYLMRAINEVDEKPVARYLHDLKPEVLLNYQCISERQ